MNELSVTDVQAYVLNLNIEKILFLKIGSGQLCLIKGEEMVIGRGTGGEEFLE